MLLRSLRPYVGPAGLRQLPARRFVGASQNIEASHIETAPPLQKTPKEIEVEGKLREAFSDADVDVQDTSGNCGRSFAISIASSAFNSLNPVQRHKLVAKVLKEDIAEWHAVQFATRPKDP